MSEPKTVLLDQKDLLILAETSARMGWAIERILDGVLHSQSNEALDGINQLQNQRQWLHRWIAERAEELGIQIVSLEEKRKTSPSSTNG